MIKFLVGENVNHLLPKAYQMLNFPYTGYVLVLALVLGLMSTSGCSSKPEATPQSSKEEIRDNADRFFEKMEQEKSRTPDQP